MEKTRIRQIRSDRVFDIINYTFLSIMLIIVLYPLVYIVSASFSAPQAVMSGRVWLLPVDIDLAGYKAVFKQPLIWTGYVNSLYYATVGTLINVTMTVMAGYPLSRKDFHGRNLIMGIFTFTMMFGGGMIPYYLLVKNLGLIDTRWAILIPNAMGVWNVILTRTYFQSTIPEELYEAAELDGCSDIKFITSVVLPLSGPILAVMVLFYAVGHWNSYFDALLFLKTDKLYPLQIILRNILLQNQIDASMIIDADILTRQQGLRELLKYSLIVVASAPVLMIYPFVQKYFVKGIMVGAIKG